MLIESEQLIINWLENAVTFASLVMRQYGHLLRHDTDKWARRPVFTLQRINIATLARVNADIQRHPFPLCASTFHVRLDRDSYNIFVEKKKKIRLIYVGP